MLELYWAEACELDPPSEGVGYGDLEANMAITRLAVSIWRGRFRAHVHMPGCSSDARWDEGWMTRAGR
jgi:hypothetical protein